ncbi:MAG: ECF transporter S component [Lachnospiraceae bacterium]|nr:ECF transporter S component [Lachnospiraceae bacterium]
MPVIKNPLVRKILRMIIPFFVVPAAVLIGAYVFEDKMYAYVSLIITILSIVLFISGFERRRTGSRRMVIVVVMTVIAVVGRFIPIIKPMAAITVISGIFLGGESGFLVGSMTAVVSNFFWGQGPWTPFQMFAWGMIGLIAGLLGKYLKSSKPLLYIYGFFSGVLFSVIMDVWTVLWDNEGFSWEPYVAAIVSAAPMTVLYALSNVLFLILLYDSIGKKLERIKTVYGI